MYKYQTVRDCISNDKNELIIYGADRFTQFPHRDASIRSKCDRVLPVARSNEIVILRGKLDTEYHKWLRSHGLGSDHVVEYDAHSGEMTLAELIANNPAPVAKIIKSVGKKPIYVPWFSGRFEAEVAKALGADLFGATETATLRYNDKSAFKTLCKDLGIAVVEGISFDIHPEDNQNYADMKSIINEYLSTYETVLIRGSLGEAGMSLYKTKSDDISEIYQEIADSGERSVIIEPFLNVSSSPNDQWAISRNGNISSLGMRDQICENGIVHIGTLKEANASADVLNYITQTSIKIVTNMAEYGYIGVVGIDYIVSDEGIFPVENNARFNGSSYVSMIVDNIEKMYQPVPYWKFIKMKTKKCSFLELTERIKPILFDGNKLNSIFPFSCDTLPLSGDFAIIFLAENQDEIYKMEEALNKMVLKGN